MNKDAKWTPREWMATDHGVGELVVYSHNSEYAICTLDDSDTSYAWKDGYSTSEEARANAHLIAAAPDMADALMCWPLSELLGMVEDSGDAAMRERAKWFMEVRDYVLAKARGES